MTIQHWSPLLQAPIAPPDHGYLSDAQTELARLTLTQQADAEFGQPMPLFIEWLEDVIGTTLLLDLIFGAIWTQLYPKQEDHSVKLGNACDALRESWTEYRMGLFTPQDWANAAEGE